MDKSVIVVFLVAATVASVTNAEVTWRVPPIILTPEGEKAGFSGGDGDPPKYVYPEEDQDNQGNLTEASVTITVLLQNLVQVLIFTRSFILAPLTWTWGKMQVSFV